VNSADHKESFEAIYRKRGFVSTWVEKSPSMYANMGYLQRNQKILSLATIYGTARPNILDIGCGTGDVLRLLYLYSIGISGIDISDINVDNCKRNLGGIKWPKDIRQGLAEDLPYPNNEFDMVIMADVIEHVLDPLLSIQEAYRVLDINGVLILTTPVKYMDQFWSFLNKPFTDHNEPVAKDVLFSERELNLLIKGRGFIVQTHEVGEFYPRWVPLYKIAEQLPFFTKPICKGVEKLKLFNYRQYIVGRKMCQTSL